MKFGYIGVMLCIRVGYHVSYGGERNVIFRAGARLQGQAGEFLVL